MRIRNVTGSLKQSGDKSPDFQLDTTTIKYKTFKTMLVYVPLSVKVVVVE